VEEKAMRKRIGAGLVIAALAAAPAYASECPALHSQVMAQTGNRFDAASHTAKALAAEGDKLHKDGKHAESVKKYEEAAKGAGLTLTRKK
jgi:hypothetical protein